MQDDDKWNEILSPLGDNQADNWGLEQVPLQFYVAHRPQYRPEILIPKLEIDGIPVNRITLKPLPGQQGSYVDLGFFSTDRTIELAWEIQTQVANSVSALIGVIHGSIQKRTVMAQVVLESFSKYPGVSSVPVKYPLALTEYGVYIENSWVFNQCENNASSVMLRNQSPFRYRVHILKQGDNDQRFAKALEPSKSHWLGCFGDGFSYSIERVERLP